MAGIMPSTAAYMEQNLPKWRGALKERWGALQNPS